jgi:hypothetical protein
VIACGGYAAGGCSTRDVFLVGRGAHFDVPAPDAGRPKPHQDAGQSEAGRPDPPVDGGSDGGFGGCVTKRTREQPVPLGIYVMVDQSSAMNPYWTDVHAALEGFIVDTSSLGGVSAGVQYYALSPTSASDTESICDWTRYAVPDVPIEPLSVEANKEAVIESIDSHGPLTFLDFLKNWSLGSLFDESPTDVALHGAVQGVQDWAVLHADDHPKATVLLVTAGIPDPSAPSKCPPTLDATIQAAANGVSGTPKVTTYVLAVGGANPNLDAVASAGDSDKAYPATSGNEIVQVLQSIREVVLPCDVSVTDADLQHRTVNVQLSVPGQAPVDYGSVPNSLGCDQTLPPGVGGEWYVQSTGSNAAVRLCPSTCDVARAAPGATLDVVLGCPTLVLH